VDSVLLSTGARGSGKSTRIKVDIEKHLRGYGRVRVWSPLEETDRYGDFLGVEPSRTIEEFVLQCTRGHAVYVTDEPTPELFDIWCKAIWKDRDCLAVVDELADVSNPGKAKGWWGVLLRKGRHPKINIAAATQRPTEIDSTIRSNATNIACFRLMKLSDQKLMADELGVELADIQALQNYQYIEKDATTGAVKPYRFVLR
jgi:hypothetical protein